LKYFSNAAKGIEDLSKISIYLTNTIISMRGIGMQSDKGEKGHTKEFIIRQKGWYVPTIHQSLIKKEVNAL
jgi:hypothetical protein